jgi:hypothetical protein
MALRCSHEDHPVGPGSFCRICGRDYVDVPDALELPALVSVGAAEVAGAELPTQVLRVPLPSAPSVPPPYVPPSELPHLAPAPVEDLAAMLPSQPLMAEVPDAFPATDDASLAQAEPDAPAGTSARGRLRSMLSRAGVEPVEGQTPDQAVDHLDGHPADHVDHAVRAVRADHTEDDADSAVAPAVPRTGRSGAALSQPGLLAVAGFGGGALVMAVLDRLVL